MIGVGWSTVFLSSLRIPKNWTKEQKSPLLVIVTWVKYTKSGGGNFSVVMGHTMGSLVFGQF